MIQSTLKPLDIKGNMHKPRVQFNAQEGNLLIEGRSIVENSIVFFEPILKWVEEYCEEPAPKTTFHIKLEYFNTSTSKFLLSIIDVLEDLWRGGSDVNVVWYYCDEDMQELGEDYKHLMDLPFTLIEYQFSNS